MKKTKVGIIFGGKSSEYPVSLHSASSLIQHLSTAEYEIILIGITQEGAWYKYDGDPCSIADDTWWKHDCTPCVFSCNKEWEGLLLIKGQQIQRVEIDCLFPIIHGKNGEDGTLQGLFEMSNIPYVGSRVLSSAICMDKEMCHIILDHAQIPCAPYISVYQKAKINFPLLFEEIVKKLSIPFFIKPANAGSSFGISKITTFENFESALQNAFFHDGNGKAIIEANIEGFEIGCAIMGNEEIVVGSVDEIETSLPFFDYAGKYELQDSKIHCPARISEAEIKAAQALAKRAYRALNCCGMARVDMFYTKAKTMIVNEVNTIPGFTENSRYPSMMKTIGIDFSTLLTHIIKYAIQQRKGIANVNE